MLSIFPHMTGLWILSSFWPFILNVLWFAADGFPKVGYTGLITAPQEWSDLWVPKEDSVHTFLWTHLEVILATLVLTQNLQSECVDSHPLSVSFTLDKLLISLYLRFLNYERRTVTELPSPKAKFKGKKWQLSTGRGRCTPALDWLHCWTRPPGVARAPPPSSVGRGDPLALTCSSELAALGAKGSWLNLPKRLAASFLCLTSPSCKILSSLLQPPLTLTRTRTPDAVASEPVWRGALGWWEPWGWCNLEWCKVFERMEMPFQSCSTQTHTQIQTKNTHARARTHTRVNLASSRNRIRLSLA